MNLIKKFKSVVALVSALTLASTMLMSSSFAISETKSKYNKTDIKSKEDAQKLLKAAEVGDKDAIECIKTYNIFDEKKVKQTMKRVRLDTKDNPKHVFDLGDGSSIEMGISDVNTSEERILQAANADYHKEVYWAYNVWGLDLISGVTTCHWTTNNYGAVDWYSTLQSPYSVWPFTCNYNGVALIYPIGYNVWVSIQSGWKVGFSAPYSYETSVIQTIHLETDGSVWND